jgi:hypothetical protein
MNKPVILEMGSSFHRGPVGEWVGERGELVYWGTLKWSIFLNGSSLRQAWSEGTFAGNPEGCRKEGLKWTALSLRALLGKL